MGDGDALSLPTNYLMKMLRYLQSSFPKLSRVSVYATAQNFLEKTESELTLLRENGLSLIYFGIETGNDVLLEKINKGVTSKQMIEALCKASNANIKISATVILGLGGEAYSNEHIRDTAVVINATRINYLSTLQLGLEEGVKERFYQYFDEFTMPDDVQILNEQKQLIHLLHPVNKIIFRSNHASNALHLSGTLPKDTARLIEKLETALNIGERAFIPSRFRGF
ncbi:MAG: radical SAM protein [Sulfuricurvum sp.]|nr:radical SAM protein [Sulfuricurvum sp.]